MKPPYQIPLMADLGDTSDGPVTISTFSGAGGSCTGMRLAGYRIAWANERDPDAAATYRANAAPGTILDTRDIRDIQPADIYAATGLEPGSIDVLEGSPPCSPFSTAGIRHKGWDHIGRQRSGAIERESDLFFEFTRLAEELQPKVIIAENVSGLVKGSAKGYFQQIMRRLAGAGYDVQARMLDAAWLGVPQTRKRVIFIGVRNDLGRPPAFPQPLRYRYNISDAIPGLVATCLPWVGIVSAARPSVTITAIRRAAFAHAFITFIDADQGAAPDFDPETGFPLAVSDQPGRLPTIAEVRRLGGFPDDYALTGTYDQRYARIGLSVPPPMMAAIARTVRAKILGPAGDAKGTTQLHATGRVQRA